MSSIRPYLTFLILGSACDIAHSDEALEERCEQTPLQLENVDTESPLGFSTQQALEQLAKTPLTTSLRWAPAIDEDIEVEFGPEAGDSTLEVQLAYKGGELRYIDRSPPHPESELNCSDYLEAEVELRMKSGAGALDERVTATLIAPTVDTARVEAHIPADTFTGSFEITHKEPKELRVDDLQATMFISPSGLSGSLSGGFELAQGGGRDAAVIHHAAVDYANWPATDHPCPHAFAASPLSEAPEPIDFLDEVLEASLDWGSGAPTALEITVTAAADHGCTYLAALSDYRIEEDGAYRLPVKVSLSSADMSTRGELEANLWLRPSATGEVESIDLSQPFSGGYQALPLAEFQDRYRLEGVDLAEYDMAALSLDASYSDAGVLTGAITVLGFVQHDCSDEPGSACAGTDIVEVATAQWSAHKGG